MNQAFNPYHQWLGLDPAESAPDFYALLSVARFEDDPARLTAAADRAMARVRAFRPGPHAAAWAQLLDDLAAAKSCLGAATRKAAYDAALRSQLPPAPGHAAVADAPPTIAPISLPPSIPAQPVAPSDTAGASIAPTRNLYPPGGVTVLEGIPANPVPAARRHAAPPPASPSTAATGVSPESPAASWSVLEPTPPGPMNAHVAPPQAPRTSSLPLAAGLAGFFIVLTAIMLFVAIRDQEAGSVPRDRAPVVTPPGPLPAEHVPPQTPPVSPAAVPPNTQAPPTKPASTPPPFPAPAPHLQTALHPPSPAPEIPAEDDTTAELLGVIEQARVAIAERDFVTAHRALDQAAQVSSTPELAARVQRWRAVCHHAEQFWSLVADTMQELPAADELVLGDGELIVVVVEASAQSVTIRSQGRNLTYTLADLPAGLALGIARRRLNDQDPTALVLLGVCFATLPDRQPEHVDQARQYWQRARAAGVDVDDLLATLTDDGPRAP